LKALASGKPGPERRYAPRHRLDLADIAAGIDIRAMEFPVGIDALQRAPVRRQDTDVGKAEIVHQRVAIGKRFPEMLTRVEEEYGQGAVYAGDEIEQHGRIRAEGRNRRDLPAELLADRDFHDPVGRQVAMARFKDRRTLVRFRLAVRQPWLRRHKAP